MKFGKATKQQAKLRMAIHGPSGAGKTFSALNIAKHLGQTVVLLDTERGSASKYSHRFDFIVPQKDDGTPEDFNGNFHPDKLISFLAQAPQAGPDPVVIVDSLSLFWNGPGGLLELVDQEVQKMKARGNKPDSFAAWKTVDPMYRRVVQAILGCPAHVLVTMRAKTEYEKSVDEKGKTSIRKVGMAPEMRNQFEYEFDVEAMLDIDHNLVIGKTRCEDLDGKVFPKPGKEFADILARWLADGTPAPTKVPQPQAPETQHPLLSRIASTANRSELTALVDELKAAKASGAVDPGAADNAFKSRWKELAA